MLRQTGRGLRVGMRIHDRILALEDRSLAVNSRLISV
jgi:hypothetical protein